MTINAQRVSLRVADHIADVRLTRPDKMNALDPPMVAAIADTIATLDATAGLRVVVLSGEGRSFCAGLDMASMMAGGSGNVVNRRSHGDANLMQQLAWGWRTLAVPVIAAAHGVCFGGGFQIFSGADIRIAHPDTRCAIMEAKWGLVPDMAGFALWRSTVRDDILRELAYTAREFSGLEAHALGFVTHLDAAPYDRAMALAREIAARSPHAVRGIKRLANLAVESDAATILDHELTEQVGVIGKPNMMEAVAANSARRAPVFQD